MEHAITQTTHSTNQLAGQLISQQFIGWSEQPIAEFRDNAFNGQVGSELISGSDRVRVWHIRVVPGQRLPAHRHVLDYFWTALTAGASTQHTDDGTTRTVTYSAGDTKHFTFASGEYLLHDLENSGDTELVFLTVELLDSANPALPLHNRQ
jgi:uncharacterized cupin superfamily protein